MVNPPYLGLIDIGNSSLKAAIAHAGVANLESHLNTCFLSQPALLGRVLSLHWLPSSDTSKPPPEEWLADRDLWVVPQNREAFRKLLTDLRQTRTLTKEAPIVWRISSVQPTALDTFIECLNQYFPKDEHHVVDRSQIPMEIDVDAPERVGIDRLLAAWGAWSLHGGNSSKKNHEGKSNLHSTKSSPLIVIQAGTAVTIDWVNEQGVYCGGAIMPGLTMSLKYMALGTAHLPWIAPPDRPSQVAVPGRNTQAAVLAGASASFLGGIQYLVSKYRKQWMPGEVPVVVSGGDKLSLADSLTKPYYVMDHLVLSALGSLHS